MRIVPSVGISLIGFLVEPAPPHEGKAAGPSGCGRGQPRGRGWLPGPCRWQCCVDRRRSLAFPPWVEGVMGGMRPFRSVLVGWATFFPATSPVRGPVGRCPRRLDLAQGVLGLAEGFLDRSFGLFDLALDFKGLIAGQLADLFLHGAFDLLGRSLDAIIVHDLNSL